MEVLDTIIQQCSYSSKGWEHFQFHKKSDLLLRRRFYKHKKFWILTLSSQFKRVLFNSWIFALCSGGVAGHFDMICGSGKAEVKLCGKQQNKWDLARKQQFFGKRLVVATNRNSSQCWSQRPTWPWTTGSWRCPGSGRPWMLEGWEICFDPKVFEISVSGKSHSWIHSQRGAGGDVHRADPPEVHGKAPIGNSLWNADIFWYNWS